MKIERRMVAAALLACGLTAGLLPSSTRAQAAPAPVPMVLISQSNEAGFPLWLAKKLGYFSENGIDATIKYFPNGGAALASGAAGDWQGGWIGSPPAARHRSRACSPRAAATFPSTAMVASCHGS